LSSISVDVFDDIVNKSMILDFRVLPFQSNVGYDVILAIDTLIQHQLLWTTFRHRFIIQTEPATPSDLLAAHISSAEAYNVEGDVREVNIPTFEPDLSTSFDDPVPWDVMPTGMSDIPTQIYGSADFQSAIRQFCREVKSEPARVEPLKVDIDWEKKADTEKWRPATSSVDGKDGGNAVTDRVDARA
jgi:hypothetical protein